MFYFWIADLFEITFNIEWDFPYHVGENKVTFWIRSMDILKGTSSRTKKGIDPELHKCLAKHFLENKQKNIEGI